MDLLATASRHNRWEPEQLTLLAALFWLGIGGILASAVLLHNWIPFLTREPIELLEAHAPLGVVGFLWLSLLGFSLKLFNMFLVSEKTAGPLSWIGCALANIALLLLVPVFFYTGGEDLGLVNGLLLAGTVAYLADIVRLWLAARRPIDWALTGAFFGLLTGVALFVWAVLGLSFAGVGEGSGFRGNARGLFVIGVFGTFSITMLALSMRVIPFLVWQIRCAPLAGRRPVPQPKELRHPAASAAVVVCLTAAWLYLAAGQWTSSSAGARLGGLCLLVGLFWFFVTILPALKAFVFGVRIEDSAAPQT